jgi:hypothetical protein
MDRKGFLKRLGIGVVAIPVIPELVKLAKEVKSEEEFIPRRVDPLPDDYVEIRGYGHHEEDIHLHWNDFDSVRVNDIIHLPKGDTYMVMTKTAYQAKLVPLEAGKPDVVLHIGNLFANFKSTFG